MAKIHIIIRALVLAAIVAAPSAQAFDYRHGLGISAVGLTVSAIVGYRIAHRHDHTTSTRDQQSPKQQKPFWQRASNKEKTLLLAGILVGPVAVASSALINRTSISPSTTVTPSVPSTEPAAPSKIMNVLKTVNVPLKATADVSWWVFNHAKSALAHVHLPAIRWPQLHMPLSLFGKRPKPETSLDVSTITIRSSNRDVTTIVFNAFKGVGLTTEEAVRESLRQNNGIKGAPQKGAYWKAARAAFGFSDDVAS